jgi:hypothetical protein
MGPLDRFFDRKKFQPVEEQISSFIMVAEFTSIEIFTNSVTQVRDIIRQNVISTLGSKPDEFNKDAWDIVLELIVFSLHLADRIAFNVLGPEKRDQFIDALVDSVSSNLAQSIIKDTTSSETRQRFQRSVLTLYNERTRFYAPLQIPSDGEAPLKGNLFWEAAKGVTNAYFPNDVAALSILYGSFGSSMESVKDLSARLEGLAR